MGLNKYALEMLIRESSRRPLKGRVLTLGVQDINFSCDALMETSKKYRAALSIPDEIKLSEKKDLSALGCISAETMFKSLGFSDYNVLDFSDYEGAGIIFDLNNRPLPEHLIGAFDVIIDGGTLEHVFHIPNALNNIYRMLRKNGRVIHVAPSSNHVDHGFYMFSPTLFMDFYRSNNFEINYFQLLRHTPRHDGSYQFFEYTAGCLDEVSFGGLDNSMYTILCIATKAADSTGNKIPQQFSYKNTWSKAKGSEKYPEPEDKGDMINHSMEDIITYRNVMDIYEGLGYSRDLIKQWASPEADIKALSDKILELKPLRILEVGTFVGIATLFMAALSPETAEVHTIDPDLQLGLEMGSLKSNLCGRDLSITTQELSRKAADRAGLANKIRWHAGGFSTGSTYASINSDPSLEVKVVGPSVCEENGPFDFIFIDGLHYTEAVLSDLELVCKYLKPGGVIALDDTLDMRWGSHVRRAIYKFLHKRSDFILFQDRNWDSLSDIAFLQHFPGNSKSYSLKETYDKNFYDRCIEMHLKTIPHIARLIYERYRPESLIDFGCGAGLWLKEFIRLGVKDIAGVDGSPAMEERNKEIADRVDVFDLRQKYAAKRRYDICLCLDVIEHLEPEYEDNLIWSCVNASATIIFSSPPPGQGGEGHVNERPISHWVEKFYQHGYIFFDEIRPQLEGMTHLPETTYQLNTFVVKKIFSVGEVQILTSDFPQVAESFKEKESRIEDLFLQNLFAKKQGEALARKMAGQTAKADDINNRLKEAFNQIQTVDFQIPKEQIVKEKGFCYVYNFRTAAGRIFAHTPFYLNSAIYENSRPLRDGNVVHDDIRKFGEGRYSMWPNQIYFSSSDNSDPRTNGCIYTLQVPPYIYLLEKMPESQIRNFGL